MKDAFTWALSRAALFTAFVAYMALMLAGMHAFMFFAGLAALFHGAGLVIAKEHHPYPINILISGFVLSGCAWTRMLDHSFPTVFYDNGITFGVFLAALTYAKIYVEPWLKERKW